MDKPEVLFMALDLLGEGPVYDPRQDELYWVDIKGKRYHRFNLKSEELKTFSVPGQISSIALGKAERIYATMEHAIYSISRDGTPVTMGTLPLEPEERFNDGKAAPMGYYVAGTMDMNETHPIGSLYSFDGKGFRKIAENMTISNGLAWDEGRRIFYHIDTPRRRVDAYSYTEDMELTHLGIAADISSEEGVPDGMCISEDGTIFVSHWGGGKVSIWDPQTKRKLDEIRFPAKNITCCTFGGKENHRLFVTSASAGPDDSSGGSLYSVDTEFRGGKQFRLNF